MVTKNRNVSIVIPCYNEEKNIPLLFEALKGELGHQILEIIMVDDGSRDTTLSAMQSLAQNHPEVKYISFSRNFGHQKALMAGLSVAQGDCVISMDGDMQHPVSLIPRMIEEWEQGADIVYTVRTHEKVSFYKRLTSKLFYKIINWLSDVDIKPGTADFRLLDRKVLVELNKMKELHAFYRGLIPWMGFRQVGIPYQADERAFGQTKYTFKKMMSFALDGVTSFSTKPLRLSVYFGGITAFLAFLYGIYVMYIRLFTEQAVSGWGSTISVILFMGGVQLIILGIIGEYIGKMYMENKHRPNYIIKDSNI